MGCVMGCATGVVKYLLFAFNLIFALIGLALVAIGALIWEAYGEAGGFLGSQVKGPPIALIVIGVVVFIVAFFGCCGAIQESHCMVMTYVIVLVTVLLAEIVLGLVVFLNRDNLTTAAGSIMTKTLDKYTTDLDSRETMDEMQTDFVCCGVNGPSDYAQVFGNDSVPASCCVSNVTATCTQLPGNEMVHQVGCLENLRLLVALMAKWLGTVVIGFAAVEVVGIVFALCLVSSIKNERGRTGF